MKKNATFVKAKGRAEIGATRRGKGMKIMAIVESPWLAAIGKHACGHPARSPPGAAAFDFYMISYAKTASR